jgi:glycolate oxidase
LEFLDRTTIACVDDYAQIGLPRDCEALVLMETDGHPAVVEEEAARMVEIARRNGCGEVRVAQDEAEATRLAAARRTAFAALARVAPTTILEDVTVPRSELAKMIRFVEATATKHRLRVGTFGHMGDGNLHPTFLTDERNADEMRRVHEAFREIFTEAIRLGGTITAFSSSNLAYNANDDISEYSASVAATAQLVRRSDGKVLWQGSLSRSETYSAKVDKSQQQAGESLAARTASRRLAEDLVARLLEDF